MKRKYYTSSVIPDEVNCCWISVYKILHRVVPFLIKGVSFLGYNIIRAMIQTKVTFIIQHIQYDVI